MDISNRKPSGLFAGKWLRTPATTEIDRLGQAQAVEHFSAFRGAGGAIEASPLLLYRRHGDRLEDLPEDAIGARRILLQGRVKLFQARLDLGQPRTGCSDAGHGCPLPPRGNGGRVRVRIAGIRPG
jgi:hypothetical protein